MIIIKLGGSLITYKSSDSDIPLRWNEKKMNYRTRDDKIRLVGRAISDCYEGDMIMIHGGGTHGHRTVTRWREGIARGSDKMKPWEVRWRMSQLTERILNITGEVGIPTIEISPLDVFTTNGKSITTSNPTPIIQALERRTVPLLRGDLVVDEGGGWNVLSGDDQAIELAKCSRDQILPEIDRMIMCLDVTGLMETRNGETRVIKEVSESDFHGDLFKKLAGWEKGSEKSVDVSGGIITKTVSAHMIAAMGCPVNIIGGENVDEDLRRILEGKEAGTLFLPFKGSSKCKKGKCIERGPVE